MFNRLRKYAFRARYYPSLPEGWLSKYQAEELYRMGREHPGPFLEIGSWIGRSTCCIAYGIRASGKQKRFISVDLGIASEDEWQAFFGQPLAKKPNKDLYLPHITRSGGSIESLKENLCTRKLDHLVEVRKGDFRKMDWAGEQFETVFCDVSHNPREVAANLPKIVELLQPNGTLVADDIRTPEILKTLLEHFPCNEHRMKEQMFIGRKA